MSTHRLIAGRDAGGFRDFLGGQAVHAGDRIELWWNGRWIAGRYECNYRQHAAFFAADDAADDALIVIDRATMLLRRPTARG